MIIEKDQYAKLLSDIHVKDMYKHFGKRKFKRKRNDEF